MIHWGLSTRGWLLNQATEDAQVESSINDDTGRAACAQLGQIPVAMLLTKGLSVGLVNHHEPS